MSNIEKYSSQLYGGVSSPQSMIKNGSASINYSASAIITREVFQIGDVQINYFPITNFNWNQLGDASINYSPDSLFNSDYTITGNVQVSYSALSLSSVNVTKIGNINLNYDSNSIVAGAGTKVGNTNINYIYQGYYDINTIKIGSASLNFIPDKIEEREVTQIGAAELDYKPFAIYGENIYKFVFTQGGPGFTVGSLVVARSKDFTLQGNETLLYHIRGRVSQLQNEGEALIQIISGESYIEQYGDKLEWVRVGHETNQNLQGFIEIITNSVYTGREASYINIRNGISSHDDLDDPSNIVVTMGNIGGYNDPVFGSIPEKYGLITYAGYFKGTIKVGNVQDTVEEGTGNNWVQIGTGMYADKYGNFRVGVANSNRMEWDKENLNIYDASNVLVFSSSGEIAQLSGWYLSENSFASSQVGSRLEMNKTLNRFSVHDDVNEKVALGYLEGLPKNEGVGTWGASDYGLWMRPGDTLRIDGDAEYIKGSWFIQNDASYLIENSGDTIARFGTDSGNKGLFVYEITSGFKLVELHRNKLRVGDTSRYLQWTPGNLTVTGTINIINQEDIVGSNINNDEGWTDDTLAISNSEKIWTDENGKLIAPGAGVPSVASLYLSPTNMGYWNGSSWQSYIQNNGNFYFSGDVNNFISWNGSVLTVRGSLTADDIIAGTLTGIDVWSSASGDKVGLTSGDSIDFYRGGSSVFTFQTFSVGVRDFLLGTGDLLLEITDTTTGRVSNYSPTQINFQSGTQGAAYGSTGVYIQNSAKSVNVQANSDGDLLLLPSSGRGAVSTGFISGTAYKISGGVGTAGQVLRSNGITGAILADLLSADISDISFSAPVSSGKYVAITSGGATTTQLSKMTITFGSIGSVDVLISP